MYEIIKKKLCIVIQDKIYLNDVLNLDPFAKMEKYYVTVKYSQIISFINKFCWIILSNKFNNESFINEYDKSVDNYIWLKII